MREFSEYFKQQARHIEHFCAQDSRFNDSQVKDLFFQYYLKSRPRYRDCLSLAYPTLKEGGKSVLDLGGWEMGVLCRPLAASILCVALDAQKDNIQDAFKINVESFDIMSPAFPLEGNRFDIVFFMEILEHLPPPLDLIMERLRGLLAPGGVMVLSVPNLAFWQKRINFFLFGRSPLKLSDTRDSSGGYHHIRPYTYDECMSLFRRYDFEVLKTLSGNYRRGWYNYPLHLFDRIFKRLSHKLIFLLTIKD
ncbi:class I SAM-dependent methyltransferase [Thermodesulfobacteriota bacterium]